MTENGKFHILVSIPSISRQQASFHFLYIYITCFIALQCTVRECHVCCCQITWTNPLVSPTQFSLTLWQNRQWTKLAYVLIKLFSRSPLIRTGPYHLLQGVVLVTSDREWSLSLLIGTTPLGLLTNLWPPPTIPWTPCITPPKHSKQLKLKGSYQLQ